jgi:hypothetical protein
MCERQTEAETDTIAVTPEMVEAGFEALLATCALEHPCEGDRYVVVRIFNAMISASSSVAKVPEVSRAACSLDR